MAKGVAASQGSSNVSKSVANRAGGTVFERFFSGITKPSGFVKASWAELKKVYSPTRKETVALTLRVLLLLTVFSFFLGVTDWIVGWGMEWVLVDSRVADSNP